MVRPAAQRVRLLRGFFCSANFSTSQVILRSRKMDNIITYDETMKHTVAAFKAAVSAVKPAHLINSTVQMKGNVLTVKGKEFQLKQPCTIVGFGKAVLEMALEMEQKLGDFMKLCVVSVPTGTLQSNPLPSNTKVEVLEGAENNLPDKKAERNAHRILRLAQNLGKDDTLVVLISGGGSALLSLPLSPITLEEKLQVIKHLANAGADILQLNCVRKRLSSVKGGHLAVAAQPATVISLILSDVIGDPVDIIASGPTSLNRDSVTAAWDVICQFELQKCIPKSVQLCLTSDARGKVLEISKVHNILVGNNLEAINTAVKELRSLNYSACAISTSIQGNVRDVAVFYSHLASSVCKMLLDGEGDPLGGLEKDQILFPDVRGEIMQTLKNRSQNNGFCLVAGGETTVKVTGHGRGGRNQELALRFADETKKRSRDCVYMNQFLVSLLSAGTDGIDGPTNAAGAFGYGEQLDGAHDYTKYLEDNDSHTFYSLLDGGKNLLLVGHTGTNVMDIHILTIQRK